MPPKKAVVEANVDPIEKLARLAAIYVTKDMPPEDAAVRLLGAGFDSPTIGGLLNKNPNFANTAKFKSKTKG
jgi:hypothetical protein